MSKRLYVGVVGVAIAACGLVSPSFAETVAPAAAAGECTGAGKFSKSINKTMGAAQDAAKDRQWNEVIAKVGEAQANSNPKDPKTAFDEFWIHRFRGNAYTGLKQYDKAVEEFVAIADSPCLKQEEKSEHFKLITRIYAQMENYPKVIEFGNRTLQIAPDADISSYVGQSYYLSKDFAGARRVMTELVDQIEKEGKQPDEQSLRIIQGACTQMKDDGCAMATFQKLVKYYPKPEHWQNIIILLSQDPKSTDKQQLNIMRLATYVDVMKQGRMYAETAQIALDQGLPGEAQSLLEKGFEQKLFTDPATTDFGKRVLANAKTAAATDKATLAQQDTAARASKTGNADVKLGAAYLSYGDAAKAIEALQRGLGKPGVKDAAEANLLLGIALLRTGNKPEAAKAFQAVNGDAMTNQIAKLWLLNT